MFCHMSTVILLTARIQATQYCDGLRGPMVVYDILDPHRWRYDIDDGKDFSILSERLSMFPVESTIITLADW